MPLKLYEFVQKIDSRTLIIVFNLYSSILIATIIISYSLYRYKIDISQKKNIF